MTQQPVAVNRTSTAAWAAALAAAASCLLAVAAQLILPARGYEWILLVLLTAAAVWAAVIDVRTLRLPNCLSAGIASAALVQAGALAIATGNIGRLWQPILAAAIVGILYLGMGLLHWCGLGDVKFATAVALAVALTSGLTAIYIVPLALLVGAGQVGIRRALGRTGKHAHGPAAAAGGVIVMAAAILLHGAS